jgi:hypothetical protein
MDRRIIALAVTTGLLALNIKAVSAQSPNQVGTLELLPTLTMVEPVAIQFPINFIPTTGTSAIYAILDPRNNAETLTVNDFDNTQSFSVTATMTNLTSSMGNTISYSDIGLVTLSQSSDGVDLGTFNIPPNAAHVITPQYCKWDFNQSTFGNQCETKMSVFTTNGSPTVSGPITIIENSSASDIGSYSLGFGIRLNINPLTPPDSYQGVLTFSLNL